MNIIKVYKPAILPLVQKSNITILTRYQLTDLKWGKRDFSLEERHKDRNRTTNNYSTQMCIRDRRKGGVKETR